MKDSVLKFAGTLAIACHQLMRSNPLDFSYNIKKIDKAIQDYDDSIFQKTYPIVVLDKCPRCREVLMPHFVEYDEFYLLCSDPDCEYELHVWSKENAKQEI